MAQTQRTFDRVIVRVRLNAQFTIFLVAAAMSPQLAASQPVGYPTASPVGPAQDQFDVARKIEGLEIVDTIKFVRDGFWVEGIGTVAFVDNNGKIRFQTSVGSGDGFEATRAVSANDSGNGWLIATDDKSKPSKSVYEVTQEIGKATAISLPLGEPVEVAAFGKGQALVRTTQPDSLYIVDGRHYRKLADRHVSSLQALSNGCVLMTSVNDDKPFDTLFRMCALEKLVKVLDIDRPSTIVAAGQEFGILSNDVISIYNSRGTIDTIVRFSKPVKNFSFDSKAVLAVEDTGSGLYGDVNYLLTRRGTFGEPTLLPITDSFGISHWISVGHGFLWLIATRPTTLYQLGDRLPTQ